MPAAAELHCFRFASIRFLLFGFHRQDNVRLSLIPLHPAILFEQVTCEDWSRWACAAGKKKKKNEVKEPQMQEVRGKGTSKERDSAEQKLQSKSALAWRVNAWRVNARWSRRHRLQKSRRPDKHCPWPCSTQKQRSRLQKSSGENACVCVGTWRTCVNTHADSLMKQI